MTDLTELTSYNIPYRIQDPYRLSSHGQSYAQQDIDYVEIVNLGTLPMFHPHTMVIPAQSGKKALIFRSLFPDPKHARNAIYAIAATWGVRDFVYRCNFDEKHESYDPTLRIPDIGLGATQILPLDPSFDVFNMHGDEEQFLFQRSIHFFLRTQQIAYLPSVLVEGLENDSSSSKDSVQEIQPIPTLRPEDIPAGYLWHLGRGYKTSTLYDLYIWVCTSCKQPYTNEYLTITGIEWDFFMCSVCNAQNIPNIQIMKSPRHASHRDIGTQVNWDGPLLAQVLDKAKYPTDWDGMHYRPVPCYPNQRAYTPGQMRAFWHHIQGLWYTWKRWESRGSIKTETPGCWSQGQFRAMVQEFNLYHKIRGWKEISWEEFTNQSNWDGKEVAAQFWRRYELIRQVDHDQMMSQRRWVSFINKPTVRLPHIEAYVFPQGSMEPWRFLPQAFGVLRTQDYVYPEGWRNTLD